MEAVDQMGVQSLIDAAESANIKRFSIGDRREAIEQSLVLSEVRSMSRFTDAASVIKARSVAAPLQPRKSIACL
jgi:hypothetical protein